MQINELLRLTNWFKKEIVEQKIPSHYTNLHKKLNRNNSSNNNNKQPFENERDKLFKSLKTVNLNTLTLEQIKFLERIGVIELVGESGIKKIKQVLYENNLDISTATNKINEYSSTISNAVETIQELENTLKKSFTLDESEEIPEESVMMRVYFQDKVAIKDVNDFKKLSSKWYDIARGITMAQNRSPEDFKIIGAQKGSIIIEMAVFAGIATSVSTILLRGLKVAERFVDLLKKVEELKGLKLTNSSISQDLKKEAEKEKKNGIDSILKDAIEEIGLNPDKEGDKITALKKSITTLVNFTEKGGAVDFVEPEEGQESEDEEDDVNNELREQLVKLKTNMQEIRKIENKIKRIEENNKDK